MSGDPLKAEGGPKPPRRDVPLQSAVPDTRIDTENS